MCKEDIICGDLYYTCESCSTSEKATLCISCFEDSIHINHDFKVHRARRSREVKCRCGLKEFWSTGVNCSFHQRPNRTVRLLRSSASTRHNVPVSPDGIPMVNLAAQSRRDSRLATLVHDITVKSNFAPLPKIAGDRYRPGAWIPYKNETMPSQVKNHTMESVFRF